MNRAIQMVDTEEDQLELLTEKVDSLNERLEVSIPREKLILPFSCFCSNPLSKPKI